MFYKSLTLASAIFCGVLSANATYITAKIGKITGNLNPNAKTHIVVAGSGGDLGIMLQQAGIAKAKKYRDLYPEDQIYFITFKEEFKNEGEDKDNFQFLNRVGFTDIKEVGGWFSGDLDGEDLMDELKAFNQIASLDIFSHGAAFYGIQLGGWTNRWDPSETYYKELNGHFAPDAFVVLHGCNTGYLATTLAYHFKVPVAGSLSATNFERPFENGLYYRDDEGRYPTTGKFKTKNDQAFKDPVACHRGGCYRLKPEDFAYTGHWGQFSGALPFYKFFCDPAMGDIICKRGMAKYAMSLISVLPIDENSSLEDYKKVIQDSICSNRPGKELQKENCVNALESSLEGKNLTFNPNYTRDNGSQAVQFECTFTQCKLEYKCEKVDLLGSTILRRSSCSAKALPGTEATTATREYKAFIDGYKYLTGKY